MSDVRSRTTLSLDSGSLGQMDSASRWSGRSGAKIPNEANFLPYRTDIVSPCELGCSVASSPRLPNSPHSQDRTLARLEERRCHRRAACQAAPQSSIAATKCGADALVRAGPPSPAFPASEQTDQGVGRGPGGPPHQNIIAAREEIKIL